MSSGSETLRILGVSGSLRAGSFSTALLTSLKERAIPPVEIRVMTLETIPLHNEDLDREPELPPVAALRGAIAGSDAVVIATPEYNHGIPGVLKNALDWASRPAFNSCFRDKPVSIISSSPAFTGGVRAQYQLRETLVSMFAHVVSGKEVVISGVHSKMINGRLTDVGSFTFIDAALVRLQSEILARLTVAA